MERADSAAGMPRRGEPRLTPAPSVLLAGDAETCKARSHLNKLVGATRVRVTNGMSDLISLTHVRQAKAGSAAGIGPHPGAHSAGRRQSRGRLAHQQVLAAAVAFRIARQSARLRRNPSGEQFKQTANSRRMFASAHRRLLRVRVRGLTRECWAVSTGTPPFRGAMYRALVPGGGYPVHGSGRAGTTAVVAALRRVLLRSRGSRQEPKCRLAVLQPTVTLKAFEHSHRRVPVSVAHSALRPSSACCARE